MSNHIKLSLFFIILSSSFLTNISLANIHQFETTHLKSTGGAGVGSLLLEESAFLNPASISYFNLSSAYFNSNKLKTTDSANNNYPDKNNFGFVLAQGQPSLSGSLSYTTQKEDEFIRKRFGVAFSSKVSELSSFGVSIKKSSDINSLTSVSSKYYQTTFGIIHILGENTNVGIMVVDPFKSAAHETLAMVGIQQNLLDYISGMIDFGANYTADQVSKNTVFRGALQVKLLDDFLLRFGGYNDKNRSESGEGFGIAWIQPKLAFEFALKNARSSIAPLNKKYKETSFSISFRGI